MKTAGIIISSKRINDWDKFVNIISEEGVFPYIIQRGLHYSSPFTSVFTTFTNVEFLWDYAKNSDFRVIYDYKGFKHNELPKGLGSIECELLFELLRKYIFLQNIPFLKNEYKIFHIVFNKILSGSSNIKGLYYSFLLSVLQENGLFPQIDSCAICGNGLARPKYFSIENGGVVCSRCLTHNIGYDKISGNFIKSLKYACQHHITILEKNDWHYDILKNFDIIKRYYYYHYKEFK
ncbi:DNA repair protein RecO [bacterium]|nr:DNA repair protein RecO [bacterium]